MRKTIEVFMGKRFEKNDISFEVKISDEDIYAAMKDIPGYIDITSGDFKALYKLAYHHALKRIAQSIKAGDIMTREVVTVERKTPLRGVAKKMADTGVAGVPVVEADKKVAGVISEKDFLSRMGAKNTKSFMGVVSECLKAKGCVAVSIRGQNAEDIMTSPAVTVHEDTSVTEIAKIFSEKNINRVPVTDKNRHLVGIISRADIVRVPVINVKTWP
jgi:CBS-domain-containing membrane protein